ncbi:MAG: SDR family NAD(P)-dependent oxidoreductase [Halioglobus sp.]|nr:SDR family NAD(P)-dependent oxidoreductase [Halioglobus sp.]
MALKQDRVVVVTGASRGAGKGIAVALGATGATVYVTGRTRREGDAPLPGTVQATAEAVTAAGGRGIAVYCDHGDDSQVAQLFEQVRREQGRLDILVNNVTVLHDALTATGPFWSKPLALADILDVGLRSHYTASWFAAPLLLANGEGLVVNTSSFGGRIYMHGPAYGAGKAGIDKMAHDMAVDFRPHRVAVIALWMGLLATERTRRVFAAEPEKYAGMAATAESPEFSGRVIDALARDPQLMDRSGQVWIGAELALAYGVTDIDGRQPLSPRTFFGDTTRFGEAIVE